MEMEEKKEMEEETKNPKWQASSSWQAVSPCMYSPEKARWTFAQKDQWLRTPCHGRPSRSRSASAHSSAGSGEGGRGEEKEAEERGEVCGIGGTHHSRGGEELHWQRGHWHYTLVIVLHKICLEAPVILREGADSPSGSEVRGICSYVPRLGSVSGAYGLKLHHGTGAQVEPGDSS